MLSAHAAFADLTSRPPVILVHGAANSAVVWRFWQAALAAPGWSSWALDLRGHGGSEGAALALASLGRESRRARDDRKAGIVLSELPCPALVVASTGDPSYPPAAYSDLAVPADRLVVEGASHWGLVLSRRLLATLVPAVTGWISQATGQPTAVPPAGG